MLYGTAIRPTSDERFTDHMAQTFAGSMNNLSMLCVASGMDSKLELDGSQVMREDDLANHWNKVPRLAEESANGDV